MIRLSHFMQMKSDLLHLEIFSFNFYSFLFCSSHYILTLLEDISPVLGVLVACSEVHTEFRSKYVCMVYCIDLLDYSDSSLV